MNRIKKIFFKQKEKKTEKQNNAITVKEEKEIFEKILSTKYKTALYCKNKKKPFIFIKDKNFPYLIHDFGFEFVEMNKNKFEYYEEFENFSDMYEYIQKLDEKERQKNKTEDDYLKDYLENCTKDYDKIIKRMKWFKIDSEQYTSLIEKIKIQIRNELKSTLNNSIDMNKDLTTTRTYEELLDNLQEIEEFAKKFPLYNRAKFDDKISHCGYPDYMWQAGVEGTYIVLKKISHSNNSLFIYNEYIGGFENEEYNTKMMIVSEQEREIILDYWDKIQDENESQFEKKCIESATMSNKYEKEGFEEEE